MIGYAVAIMMLIVMVLVFRSAARNLSRPGLAPSARLERIVSTSLAVVEILVLGVAAVEYALGVAGAEHFGIAAVSVVCGAAIVGAIMELRRTMRARSQIVH